MKSIFRSALILSIVLSTPLSTQAQDQVSSPRFVTTYFYTSVRCPSCLTIERWTSETIRKEFADEMENGVLAWRTINIDGEGNFHYVKDYSLYTKSVIISEMDGDREIRWKNLARVWELLRDESSFGKYIRSEVRGFMEQH